MNSFSGKTNRIFMNKTESTSWKLAKTVSTTILLKL